ncbi:MAG: hypothetical protein QCI38_02350 [Candidatus Thermoplasmatota archaeon]|nr:hypothetical protein [Candidatus Thermoplasmatota archaeon]
MFHANKSNIPKNRAGKVERQYILSDWYDSCRAGWSEASIYGALLIAFIAQLFISLMRFEHKELKHISPKFIRISLMNLTVTVELQKSGTKRHIFSNFNPLSEVVLAQKTAIT